MGVLRASVVSAEKTSVVSAAKTSVVSAAKKATTSAATSDISMKSTTPWGGAFGAPWGVADGIEMSDVAADVAAFLAADTTDVLAADTTDVLSAAKAADGGFCPAVTLEGPAKSMVLGLIGLLMAPNQVLTGSSGSDLRGKADYGFDSAPNIRKDAKMIGDPAGSGRIF